MPEVTLTTLSYGGDCLGRLPDGRVVFVPFGIPGEKVAIEILADNKNFARGKLVKVLEPSTKRIEPTCKHFGRCGGCHAQHMTYEAQLEYKAAILSEQLTRVGKLADPPNPQVIQSPNQYQYRNNLRFHINDTGKLGFRAPHSDRIIPVSECHLPEKAIQEAWPFIELEADSGIEQIELRGGMDGELLITLEGSAETAPEFETEAGLSAVYAGQGGRIILAGEDLLPMQVCQRSFQVSGGSFFQVNTRMAEAMITTLKENLVYSGKTILADLYCGVGLFSAFFAGEVKEVIGVELSPDACLDFAANLDEFDNVSLYEGAVESVLPRLEVKADVVILDPPRAGLHPKALEALMAAKPAQIAYISCDPATLARDLGKMVAGGYHIEKVCLLDLFPQTFHIESMVFLSKHSD
ncbi:MAG: class I SAM-dependent RNA methyltransferase [Anaerolineaceae bacterium]|nr:class I SAM-dependent RNA methyltransferase [Anaerolineaceae bacterium]